MRYKPGHKEEKRKELLKASGAVVKANGFAATGVDALMQAAGVTSGAFYSHFSSKTELLKALIESELLTSREMWAGNPHETAEDWLSFELDRYLSPGHAKHPEAGCILPSLAAEISRADDSVRELFEKELLKGQQVLAQRLGSDELAWSFLCQLVGAILLARTMPGEAMQRSIIEASKHFLKDAIARLSDKSDEALPVRRKRNLRRTTASK
ncbi:MAG TPA: TetR/AcrR family transcriptional regulator [Noviherbaspirillum sp.]|jgi:AcrR family transcriptional regulator|uniref:TetR/AcrR family transcriptional regulator n=1 Tax=Noviherbaspirillum sp. TaxID=1926288 RepID=UPI002DDCD8E3|nr:TetR/AcrR family transcriptional regulator [Noviherbaspirillum sp.]HEV2612829.1 TetR/AcrR family transcriptional regulator [Noviherbaspirillum sp.]